ncbi:MAG: flagellar filament capping protein FliD [Treponema sp.]|jgi:flagellar hook-associated protein 2|nr:flagellar filament capping protein FliD [Treponema sp.]
MSDVYIPGVKSRFNTENLVEGLMRVERIPRERVGKDIENLQIQKTYWQELGRRMSALRESARSFVSFQNPFNDRIVASGDESILVGTATREAVEQTRSFTVKQTAQADRFLSQPLEEGFKVEAGNYVFTVGKDEVSFNFRGGTLREFADALNRRSRDKIQASVITIQKGSKSLLIESKVTGAENRLSFSRNAENLPLSTGKVERPQDSRRNIAITSENVTTDGQSAEVLEDTVTIYAGGQAAIPLTPAVQTAPGLVFTFEAATKVFPEQDSPLPRPSADISIPEPDAPEEGDLAVETEAPETGASLAAELPSPSLPLRVDDLEVITLQFTDGSSARVPALQDSETFHPYRFPLPELTGGKIIASIDFINQNTHRDVSIRNIMVFDPGAEEGARTENAASAAQGSLRTENPVPIVQGGFLAGNAISTAQDAVISMEGIEISRDTNTIDDLVPGVTLTVKAPSERPVKLEVLPDREGVKEAIISLVGNYNRLMAEVNVLTRIDDRIVQELSYLSPEEQEEMRKKLGVFAGESSLVQFKAALQQTVTGSYLTFLERDLTMLPQIGISTDARKAGATTGYDPSRLRGYLEIDEKVLDAALESRMPAIQQLFGYDTDGDLIIDSGVAYMLDQLAKPYVETGGVITLKTGVIDSRIAQDNRRIETMDRQLAAKEASLKNQYAQMEGAYNRMEQMSTSLDQFSQRANNNNR